MDLRQGNTGEYKAQRHYTSRSGKGCGLRNSWFKRVLIHVVIMVVVVVGVACSSKSCVLRNSWFKGVLSLVVVVLVISGG